MCRFQSKEQKGDTPELVSKPVGHERNASTQTSQASAIKNSSNFRAIEGIVQRKEIRMQKGDPFYRKVNVSSLQENDAFKYVKKWYSGQKPIQVKVKEEDEIFEFQSSKETTKKDKMRKIEGKPKDAESKEELTLDKKNPTEGDYVRERDICLPDTSEEYSTMFRKETLYKGTTIYSNSSKERLSNPNYKALIWQIKGKEHVAEVIECDLKVQLYSENEAEGEFIRFRCMEDGQEGYVKKLELSKIAEDFDDGGKNKQYRQWVDSAQETMRDVLNAESTDSKSKDIVIKRDLESILSRNQFQAPIPYIKSIDTIRNKDKSPLDVNAYARGTETKLWKLLNHLQVHNIKEHIKESENYNFESSKYMIKKLSKYELFSIIENIAIFGRPSDSCKDITKFLEEFAKEEEKISYYIEEENVLLVKKGDGGLSCKVDEKGGRIDSSNPADKNVYDLKSSLKHNFNSKGLRMNISQSIQKEAELMKSYMEKRGYSDKVVGKMLNKIIGLERAISKLRPIFTSKFKTEQDTREEDGTIQDALLNEIDKLEKETSKWKGEEQKEFFHSNIEIVKKLIEKIPKMEKSPKLKFEINTVFLPFHEFIDTMSKRETSDNIQEFAIVMENFYFTMQKLHQFIRECMDVMDKGLEEQFGKALVELTHHGENDSLGDENKAMNPKFLLAEAHGMAIYRKFSSAIASGDESKNSAEIIDDAYFETPELFQEAITKGKETKFPKVFIMEPHPNNAAMDVKKHNNPLKYVSEIMKERRGQGDGEKMHEEKPKVDGEKKTEVEPQNACTIMMDVTLNCLADNEILELLRSADVKKWVDNGELNLVLLQSGTKFYTLGMDIASVGTALVYNNKKNWLDFNKNLFGEDASKEISEAEVPETKYKINIPKKDQKYLTEMLKLRMGDEKKESYQQLYLKKIKKNARTLYDALKVMNGNDEFAISVLESIGSSSEQEVDSIKENVYVAVKLKDSYINAVFNEIEGNLKALNLNISNNEFTTRINIKFLYEQLKKILRPYGVYDRQSFGFDITNLGECGTTVRITTGIEPGNMIKQYADRIIELSKDIKGGNKSNEIEKVKKEVIKEEKKRNESRQAQEQ